MKTSSSDGFTVLEVLVVLSIIGILIGFSFNTYRKSITTNQVREAALLVAQQVSRTQVQAKRENKRWTFQVIDVSSYKLGPAGTTFATLPSIPLPSGVKFSSVSTMTAVNFDPPYGARSDYLTGGSAVPTFTLVATGDAATTRSVKIVSVLGQVVIQ